MFNHAIILAAGRGIRLMPLTKNIPKALVKVQNQTLILNGIKKLKKYIKNIHITVGYKGSLIAKHVISHDVSSVINTNKKGNSWWIFNFPFNLLNEPIVVLTCDNITNIDFKLLKKDYMQKKSPPCYLIPVKPIKKLDGDYIHRKKNIVKKLSRKNKSDIYCSGIQIINPYQINKLVNKTKDFNALWNQLIKKNKLYVSDIIPKQWFTIDKIEHLNIFKKNLS
tara:strand:- start:3643 stop:4311 length:669 start_codon:yes stop_codon:yes gene_type:complete